MKNKFITTLLCLSMIGNLAMAQTKKPTTTTKKPSTTVKSTAPKATTKTSTTTTTTSPSSTTTPTVVEEKKTTTTTTTGSSSNINSSNTSSSTTIQQSSGPSKGAKKPAEPKPEKVKEPKPERVREPKPEKVKTPRSASSDDVGTHFGIKAGANSLFFLSSGKISGGTPAFSIGFHGGIVGNFGLSETVAIQAEALYIQQSVKFADGADNITFVGSGIEIPLALQFNFGGDTKFFINAGGYASYELSSSYSGVVGGVSTPSTSKSYTGVAFGDRTDYGAILGLGVKFNQALFVEARANYSVKEGSYTDTAGKKIVPIFAGLSLGYFF